VDLGKMRKVALSESIDWQTLHVQKLEESIPAEATRACNAHGFYQRDT